MNNWIYIDEINELNNFDNMHCDTRDFHMICFESDENPDIVLDRFIKNNQDIVKKCLFKSSEIIPMLKELEINSGGKRKWRNLSINKTQFYWLKYIRFKKIDTDTYFCYTTKSTNIFPIEKNLLKPENIIKNN